jgi:hypothetical protein
MALYSDPIMFTGGNGGTVRTNCVCVCVCVVLFRAPHKFSSPEINMNLRTGKR